ncbi:MAG: hypothetical protein ACOH2M_11770 [Cypionkella sp.]
MHDFLQPLITKAQVVGLRVNVNKAGLCIGDTAHLEMLEDGQIGLFAQGQSRWLGLFPRRNLLHLGQLGPAASKILAEPMRQDMHLRVRIVGLTPEHLSETRQPEIFVSVWGAVDRLLGVTPANSNLAKALKDQGA